MLSFIIFDEYWIAVHIQSCDNGFMIRIIILKLMLLSQTFNAEWTSEIIGKIYGQKIRRFFFFNVLLINLEIDIIMLCNVSGN